MKIRQRKFLVILLVTSQLGCMIFGLASAAGWLHGAVSDVIAARVSAEGRSLAHELAAGVGPLGATDVEPGTDAWIQLQDACSTMRVPYDGFAAALCYDTGALICHTELTERPQLLRLFPGRNFVSTKDAAGPLATLIRDRYEAGERITSGRVVFDGQLHVITAYAMPDANLILAVYQSDAAVEQAISEMVYPVTQVGCVLTALTIGAACLLTIFIVNRYEDTLADANQNLEAEVEKRTKSLVRTRDAVIFGLAKLAESRDNDTGAHLERIRLYVTILAGEMARTRPEINHDFVSDLVVASSLHDIGKVGIPDAVLLKPGRLTPTERSAMQLHTELGSQCLAAIQKQLGEDDFLEIAQQIAVAHHEHWDGSGYPRGLQGKNIPLPARIVALADVYDALTTRRPYKGPMSHAEAREWIVSRYETQFDPETVEAFVAREADFARISRLTVAQYEEEEKSPVEEAPRTVEV